MVAISIRKSGIEKLREERELKIKLDSGEVLPSLLSSWELLAKAFIGQQVARKALIYGRDVSRLQPTDSSTLTSPQFVPPK